MMDNLVFIKDLVFFQEGPGVRKTQFRDKGVKLLNVGNINNNKLTLSKTKIYISEEEAYNRYKHFLIDEGDLLIACSGIVVNNFHNKITFAKKEHLPLALNTSTMRFKSLDNNILDIKYFYYFLMTNLFKKQIGRLITGSAQLNFGPTHIKKIKIPLIDISEQKTIAKKLDKAKELIELRKASIEKLDELAKAIFADMFGDPVRNPMGWEVVKLKNLTLKIGSGSTPKGGKNAYKKKGLSLIRSLNIYDNKFKYENLAFIDEKQANKLSNVIIEKNDILLNITGASVCRSTIVPNDILPARVNQHVAIIRVNNKIHFKFLLHLLISFEYKQKLMNIATSGGTTREALTKENLKILPIIIPPINLQNKFAKIIQKIEAQKALYEEELEKLEYGFEALLSESFA